MIHEVTRTAHCLAVIKCLAEFDRAVLPVATATEGRAPLEAIARHISNLRETLDSGSAPSDGRAGLQSCVLAHLVIAIAGENEADKWVEAKRRLDFCSPLEHLVPSSLNWRLRLSHAYAMLHCGDESLIQPAIAQLTKVLESADRRADAQLLAECHHFLVRAYVRWHSGGLQARRDGAWIHYERAYQLYELASTLADECAQLYSDISLALLLTDDGDDSETAISMLLSAKEECQRSNQQYLGAEIDYRVGLAYLYRQRGERLLNCEEAVVYLRRSASEFDALGRSDAAALAEKDLARAQKAILRHARRTE